MFAALGKYTIYRLSKNSRILTANDYFCFMVEITDKLVDDLAHLSRLNFNDAEREEIKSDLQQMIAFVEQLNEIDTTGVAPLLHITPRENVFREDVVVQTTSREEALQNVPDHDEKYIRVPKVIKK